MKKYCLTVWFWDYNNVEMVFENEVTQRATEKNRENHREKYLSQTLWLSF